MPILLELFLTFLKIGAFTFGGGYAMIPVIEHDCVEKKNWITHDDMMNMTVIAESTPGPIAINAATFVGCRQAGFWGAVAATLGVVLPSFVIIFAISVFLDNFMSIAIVANAFKGIKIGVGLLILNAGINMIKKMKKTLLSVCLMLFGCLAMLAVNFFSVNLSSITLMLLAAAISLGVFLAKGGGRK